MMEHDSGKDGRYTSTSYSAIDDGVEHYPPQSTNTAAGGKPQSYDDMSSKDRAAMLLQLGAGLDDDSVSGIDLNVSDDDGDRRSTKGKNKKKKKQNDKDAKPLALWRLRRDHNGAFQLVTEDDDDHGVDLEIRMPPLQRRIAMNLSLSEQPHNGIELNGQALDVEKLVGSTGTSFTWGEST